MYSVLCPTYHQTSHHYDWDGAVDAEQLAKYFVPPDGSEPGSHQSDGHCCGPEVSGEDLHA